MEFEVLYVTGYCQGYYYKDLYYYFDIALWLYKKIFYFNLKKFNENNNQI